VGIPCVRGPLLVIRDDRGPNSLARKMFVVKRSFNSHQLFALTVVPVRLTEHHAMKGYWGVEV